MIMHLVAISFLFMMSVLPAQAQEDAFTPPVPHPVDRYEAGWNTNPFTLKTAAPAIQKESFAKDLVLGSMNILNGETLVVLINSKTRERIRLSSKRGDPNGLLIKSANILSRRSDSYAEIEKNGEVAVLRYDDKLLKQLSVQGQMAQQNDTAAHPALANTIAATIANPAAARTAAPVPGQGPYMPPASAPRVNAMRTMTAAPATAPSGLNRNAPPQRRRLLTAPRPVPTSVPPTVRTSPAPNQR